MRTAMFGGSFDPVHIGHLFVAEEARVNLGYERVTFVPAYLPPHKPDAPQATAEHRVEMLSRALSSRSDFVLEDYEVRRQGLSFTIDTVEYLYRTHEIDGRLGLIIGDDLLPGFHTWRRAEELEKLVDIVVATRDGAADVPQKYSTIDNSTLPVSSSQVRERAGAGKAYRYLVPESVYAYIHGHGIYTD
ncbi:MAG: nicotinate (nicotinamide) nucleotide adenylyltransferase [Spirochaetaceae bacterium]